MKLLFKSFLILVLLVLSCIFVKAQDTLDNDDNHDSDEYEEEGEDEEDPDLVGIIIGILIGAFVLLVVISVIMVLCCCIFNGTAFIFKRSRQPANHVEHYAVGPYPGTSAAALNPHTSQSYPGPGGAGYPISANPVEGQLPAYEAVVKEGAPPAYEYVVTENEKNGIQTGYSNEAYGDK